MEVRSALYNLPSRPAIINYIYGLGGRDITVGDLEGVYQELQRIVGGQIQKTLQYLGVRNKEGRNGHFERTGSQRRPAHRRTPCLRRLCGADYCPSGPVGSGTSGRGQQCHRLPGSNHHPFPYTAWKVPFIHNAFENSAATISGVEAAYTSLKKQGKYDKEVRFIAFGGDGGTYDIGLQSLSAPWNAATGCSISAMTTTPI